MRSALTTAGPAEGVKEEHGAAASEGKSATRDPGGAAAPLSTSVTSTSFSTRGGAICTSGGGGKGGAEGDMGTKHRVCSGLVHSTPEAMMVVWQHEASPPELEEQLAPPHLGSP